MNNMNAPPGQPVEYEGSRGPKLDLLRLLLKTGGNEEDPADWIERRRAETWSRPSRVGGPDIVGCMSYAQIADEINDMYAEAGLPTTVTHETVRRWHAGE